MASIAKHIAATAHALKRAGLYFGHGTSTAFDEAAWLVLHAARLPLDTTGEAWRQELDPAAANQVRELLQRRIQTAQPLAYLLGEAWFAGLKFIVTPDVLVPRSPIAELVLNGFQPWLLQTPRRALDLCTGSGCIAIAMAHYLPGLQVDASDISGAALQVAARNAELNGLSGRIQLIESDLFRELQGCRYDLIVSNPPYVPQSALASLPAEYHAEPPLGLFSPGGGLELPLRILRDSADYLESDGLLVCEAGESAGRLQAALPQVPFTWLEFEHGGEGVFTMDRKSLLQARKAVAAALENLEHVG